MATLIVTNLNATGVGSLKEAVIQANANGTPSDVIITPSDVM
jgi:hypothetical protein